MRIEKVLQVEGNKKNADEAQNKAAEKVKTKAEVSIQATDDVAPPQANVYAVDFDINAFSKKCFVDVFYDDVYIQNLLDEADELITDNDAMNNQFAYFFGALFDDCMHSKNYLTSIFSIDSMPPHAFNLGTFDSLWDVMIGASLTPEEKERMKNILIKHKNALPHGEIVEHKIPTYSNLNLVKQKLRR